MTIAVLLGRLLEPAPAVVVISSPVGDGGVETTAKTELDVGSLVSRVAATFVGKSDRSPIFHFTQIARTWAVV
jgi:hypothetical protein